MNALSSLLCGLLFGLGLWISGMAEPAKIIGFLDMFGRWDPSLAIVMASAVAVTMLGYRFVLARPVPLLAKRFQLPAATRVDARLIVGSVLFGIGWGVGGYCPGPSLLGLSLGGAGAVAFVAAMIVGIAAVRGRDAQSTTTPVLEA